MIKFIKVILRGFWLLMRIIGLCLTEKMTWWAGFIVLLICIWLTKALPKSQKEKDEKLIRDAKVEKIKQEKAEKEKAKKDL